MYNYSIVADSPYIVLGNPIKQLMKVKNLTLGRSHL